MPPIGGLGRVLGKALHDPTTRLLYRRQGVNDEYLIDADGNPAQPSAGSASHPRPTPSPTSITANPSLIMRAP